MAQKEREDKLNKFLEKVAPLAQECGVGACFVFAACYETEADQGVASTCGSAGIVHQQYNITNKFIKNLKKAVDGEDG